MEYIFDSTLSSNKSPLLMILDLHLEEFLQLLSDVFNIPDAVFKDVNDEERSMSIEYDSYVSLSFLYKPPFLNAFQL